MTMTISGTDGLTFPDSTAQYSGSYFSFKNRIINGDMRIDQRNAGAAVTANGAYPVDRFYVEYSMDGAYSAERNTTAPAGFINSLKFTTTTADASLSASQYVICTQNIEGLNCTDLGWGTANAKTVTLSFWVRSSLTGTFAGSLKNSASNRSYPFTYSISVADTWEQKSITIAGDTSGTWLTTNGIGIALSFGLGVGSTYSGTAGSWAGANYVSATGATSVIGTLNATWYITGVQLEVGSTATPFERRPYGTELMLCQRYYAKLGGSGVQYAGLGSGFTSTTTRAVLFIPWHTAMRAAPTISISNMAVGDWENYTTAVTLASQYTNVDGAVITCTGSGFTAFRPAVFQQNTSAGYVDMAAEL